MKESEQTRNMSGGNKCPQCGAPLPAGVLAGLCPACLLKQGTAESGTQPETAPFEPPSLQELARLFPSLEIIELLGKGGMGAVYKARQPGLDRLVALKILPPELGSGAGFPDRFTREARALARLNHPNIVAVYEFGQAGALHYFVMEYVDGTNLRHLEQAGRLSSREALQIVPQICDALQYAHDEGVVHRDIKPENVLVDRKGRVKIADFGLAKILGREPTNLRLTAEGQVMGTPHYMAPEQVEHPQAVDHRADIYALGVVFYEMLTGELPLGKFPPPSRKLQIDVRLDDVVLRALEKEPELRYQHASEVKSDVQSIAATPPKSVPPSGVVPPAQPGASAGESWSGGARFSRAAIVGAIWAFLFFVAAVPFFTLYTVPQGSEPPGPAWWQKILLVILIPGFAAPFGTTILGCVALAQIRRSAGRLYGLGLAVFDALFFPLLTLDVLIILALQSLFEALGIKMDMAPMILICLPVDAALVWLVWRALTKPQTAIPSGHSLPPRAQTVFMGNAALQPEIARRMRGPAIGLIVTGILDWILIPLAVIIILQRTTKINWPFAITSPYATVLPWLGLIALFLSSFIIFSALRMKRLEGYGSAVAASILAVIISPGNIIGLPLGIWALSVLTRKGVRQAFPHEPAQAPAQPLTFRLVTLPIFIMTVAFALLYWGTGRPGEVFGIWLPWGGIMLGVTTIFFAWFWLAWRTANLAGKWISAVALPILGLLFLGMVLFSGRGDVLSNVPVGLQGLFCIIYAAVLILQANSPDFGKSFEETVSRLGQWPWLLGGCSASIIMAGLVTAIIYGDGEASAKHRLESLPPPSCGGKPDRLGGTDAINGDAAREKTMGFLGTLAA